MAAKIKIEKERVIVSSDWLCKELGVTPQTLANWRDDGCPKHKYGQWDLLAVLWWRGAIGSGGALAGAKGSLQEQKLQAEVNFKETQAELQGLKRDILAGKYLERDVIVADMKRFFAVFKRSAQAMPRRVGLILSGVIDPVEARRIEKQAEEDINNALTQMSVGGVFYAKKK